METEKLNTSQELLEKEIRAKEQQRRDRYFAYIATFMKGCPVVSGERLRKLQASCPPKQYRKAVA